MNQIREDMKNHKRMLSTDTEGSGRLAVAVPYTPDDEVQEPTEADIDIIDVQGVEDTVDTVDALLDPQDAPPTPDNMDHLRRGLANVSIDSQGMLDQFPAPPLIHISDDQPVSSTTTLHLSANIDVDPDLYTASVPGYTCARNCHDSVFAAKAGFDTLRLIQHSIRDHLDC